jgi:hypothetical protein
MSPIFLESSLVVVATLVILGAVFIVLKITQLSAVPHSKATKEEIKSNKCTREFTDLGNAISILYRWLLFPTITGFWLALSISGYVSNFRFAVEHEGIFAFSLFSSLAMLVAWTVVGCIFFFEVCYCDVKHRLRGEKKVSNWYIPFFLLRIGCLSLLLQLGIYLQFSRMFYPVLGVELIYFVVLLFRRSYLSVLHKVCASIVETPPSSHWRCLLCKSASVCRWRQRTHSCWGCWER